MSQNKPLISQFETSKYSYTRWFIFTQTLTLKKLGPIGSIYLSCKYQLLYETFPTERLNVWLFNDSCCCSRTEEKILMQWFTYTESIFPSEPLQCTG